MKIVLINLLLMLITLSAQSQVSHWRGPARDGHFAGTGLLKEWPAEGPELILEVEGLGKGWSTPITTGDMIYITGMTDTLDYLSAVDLSGNIIWQVPYGRSWNQSFPDTRATPVVEDNRIYVQSGTGEVSCINRIDGQIIWNVAVDKSFGAEYHTWGNSETPLIVDDKVICSPGGKETSIVALDKLTGETVWKSKSLGSARGYGSATLYEYNGHRFILAVNASHIMAVDPDSGEIAWYYQYFDPEKWTFQDNGLIWANTPIYKDNEIFISMGYDYPAVMLEMDESGTSVTVKYVNTTLDNHHHGVIQHDGYIYGSNWANNKQGSWVCLDWDTGEVKYEQEWDTKGVLVMADGLFYAYNERGNVGLVKPGTDGFEVVSQFKITKGAGPHWAHPAISDGKLFMRHGEVMMVYDIMGK